MFSELRSGTHRFEEVDTKGAGHPIDVDDLYLMAANAFLPWYSDFQFSTAEVLTE